MKEPTIKIRVTTNDIKHAERAKCANCPIARALNRMSKHTWYVNYNAAITMRDNGADLLKRIILTDEMENFIRAFDRGRQVKPTTFIVPALNLEIHRSANAKATAPAES